MIEIIAAIICSIMRGHNHHCIGVTQIVAIPLSILIPQRLIRWFAVITLQNGQVQGNN